MSKRTNKKYTLEFKQSSAKLAVTADQPIHQTAVNLGVSPATLYGWVKTYHPDSKHSNTDASNIESELKQLKKDFARVKQERDILKKAVAYFASDAV